MSFSKKDIKNIREEIRANYAQTPSPNDRCLDLDNKISTFGDTIERREEFARDRDRIIHSSAFRRLEHKAQVYSHEKGDHYRTRLTHTLEVMQIARGIARNLGLNEDLTEAIALGHDIGHTPFGHAGEEILDKIMRGEDDLGGKLKYHINYGGFKHNFHSLKILDIIESKYEGLNLTWQVLEGILKHTKIKKPGKTWDLSRFVKNDNFFKPLVPNDTFKSHIPSIDPHSYSILLSPMLNLKPYLNLEHSLTLEGQIVNLADEIAQRQHDLDDGLRDVELRMKESDVLDHFSIVIEKIIDKVLEEEENLTEIVPSDLKLLKELKDTFHHSEMEEDNFKWKKMIRDVISYFIHDVTLNTMKNIINEEFTFYKDNLRYRQENFEYLISKGYTNASVLLEYKRLWNRRNYAMNQYVGFSETATKFNEKIEQYIENRIINSYNVNRFDGKAKFIIRQLFKAYYENPKQMNKNQLNNLSNLINDNLDNYYELKFIDGTKVRDIKFNSQNPEFVLNLKDVSRLINLLKLEVKLEDLNNPSIKLDLTFLKELNGSIFEISQKWGCLDREAYKMIIFEEILYKINQMDKSAIKTVENKEKREKILFIKCLIENHYAYLSVICDHIAGMTDNYAKNEYKKLYLV